MKSFLDINGCSFDIDDVINFLAIFCGTLNKHSAALIPELSSARNKFDSALSI